MNENPLPREIAPGVFWIGKCLRMDYNGDVLHGYGSQYLVAGAECSLLVEAGLPQDRFAVQDQLDGLFAGGVPELRYIFTTHQETPHAGGLGHLLARYPNTIACGDVSDFHLIFPEFAARLRQSQVGDTVDLGGRTFKMVEAVFRDYLNTLWGFETETRTLFPGDGFSYAHQHHAGQCGKVAEEVTELDIPTNTALYSEAAFIWTRYSDIEPYIARMDGLIRDVLDAGVIAPTHGLPITDRGTLPQIWEGLRKKTAALRWLA